MSRVLYTPPSRYEITPDRAAGVPFWCGICCTIVAFEIGEIEVPNRPGSSAVTGLCPTCKTPILLNNYSRTRALEQLKALSGVKESPAGVPPEQQP